MQLKLSRAVTVDMLEISTSILPYFTVLHYSRWTRACGIILFPTSSNSVLTADRTPEPVEPPQRSFGTQRTQHSLTILVANFCDQSPIPGITVPPKDPPIPVQTFKRVQYPPNDGKILNFPTSRQIFPSVPHRCNLKNVVVGPCRLFRADMLPRCI